MFSSSLLFAAALAGVHSFSFAAAAVAENPQITPSPSPTVLDKRQVAGGGATPILSTLKYAYTDLPYQVYPFAVLRGPQFGFNQCNSTTLGPNSNCQTLVFNGPDDFCLWGSPDASGLIGNVEAKVVAYCTKPYHGTRLIPPGAITGMQWTKTSGYIQAVGFVKNPGIGLDPTDQGGELDPHGADLQGNPLGGVVYSNGTADSDGHTLAQVFNWNTFVGGNQFCFKACYNSISSPDYCENRFDLVGCSYNMPSAAKDGEFTVCDGDLQDPAGIYTTDGGATVTWSMPDPLNTPPPYQPRVPASSNCKTYQSTDLFLAGAATDAAAPSGTGTTPAGTTPKPTGSSGASGSGSKSGSAGGAASTGGSSSSASKGVGVSAGSVVGLLSVLAFGFGGALVL